jgi:hypothetical protein
MSTRTTLMLDNTATAVIRSKSRQVVWLGWTLMLPLLLFAARGTVSFQFAGRAAEVYLHPAAAARNPGLLGRSICSRIKRVMEPLTASASLRT